MGKRWCEALVARWPSLLAPLLVCGWALSSFALGPSLVAQEIEEGPAAITAQISRVDEAGLLSEAESEEVLGLIPANAVATLLIHDIERLTQRGDVLVEELETESLTRLSEGYDWVVQLLGLRKGLDPKGSAALSIVTPAEGLEELVLSVPVKDFDQVAESLEMDSKLLEEGVIVGASKIKGRADRFISGPVVRRGNQLLLGLGEEALKATLEAGSVYERLDGEERRLSRRDDVVVYFNPTLLPADWGWGVEQAIEDQLDAINDRGVLGREERQVIKELAGTIQDLEFCLVRIGLGSGMRVTLDARFEGEESREFLSRYAGGSISGGMPGEVATARVLSQLAAGHGEHSGILTQSIVRLMASFNPEEERTYLARHLSPQNLGVFAEVQEKIESSRSTLYANLNPERRGAFAMVSLLDVGDTDLFLEEMTELASFIAASELRDVDFERQFSDERIQALIQQLASPKFTDRRAATNRLVMLGPRVVEPLHEAAESEDLEIRYRATEALKKINLVDDEENREFLQDDLLERYVPRFAWLPEQSRLGDQVVHEIRLEIDEEDENVSAVQLQRLFGLDWNRIRVVPVGETLVVFVGSNDEVFEAAVEGVVTGEFPGAVAGDVFDEDKERSAAIRWGGSFSRLAKVMAGEALKENEGPARVTSAEVRVEPERVQFSVALPPEDVRVLLKAMGYIW